MLCREPLSHLLVGPRPLERVGVEPVVLRPGRPTWAMYSSRLDHDPASGNGPKAWLSNSAWFSQEAWAGVNRGRHQPPHPAR